MEINKTIRKITFGKYKGQPILYLISIHIGYIMWCLENVPWFELNEVEQKYYDWTAIAIKKYEFPMTFPVEVMYKHIKDRKAFANLCTPLQLIGKFDLCISGKTEISNLLRESGVIVEHKETPDDSLNFYDSVMPALAHSAAKEIQRMSDEELQEMNNHGIALPDLDIVS